jgi:hypothetical protein
MSRLPAVAFYLGLAFSLHAEDPGRIHGEAVDVMGAAIEAGVRVIAPNGRTVYRATAAVNGTFELSGISPGAYRIALSRHGFREKFADFTIAPGADLDLGRITLDVAGCDWPGVICDTFTSEPVGPSFRRRDVTVSLNAADAELHLVRQSDGHLYLTPGPRVRLSEPNSAAAYCRSTAYRPSPVRIDGLGPGSDICMVARNGRTVHLFFTAEVDPDASTVTFVGAFF